jgi:hypothetical protein
MKPFNRGDRGFGSLPWRYLRPVYDYRLSNDVYLISVTAGACEHERALWMEDYFRSIQDLFGEDCLILHFVHGDR